tara:strand:+ start:733 stop:1224 length:492 start_codon:yes stop_codon:yes gene_type:complete
MNEPYITELCREASRIQEDSIHSAKGHYNTADRWNKIHLWIGIPNAVLAAIAGLSAFNDETLIAGSLAVSVAAITAITTFLNPGDRSSTHKRCAGEYLSLRNKSRIFENITSKHCKSEEELTSRFEEMINKRDDLNATSPQIPEWAFNKARKGIEEGESTYKT